MMWLCHFTGLISKKLTVFSDIDFKTSQKVFELAKTRLYWYIKCQIYHPASHYKCKLLQSVITRASISGLTKECYHFPVFLSNFLKIRLEKHKTWSFSLSDFKSWILIQIERSHVIRPTCNVQRSDMLFCNRI